MDRVGERRMTGLFLLDWAMMAASLFNTILLLWLGMTVLLNAERRNLGIWIAGGGMLMGAAFFVSHTIILGQQLNASNLGLDFWWHLGWIPVIVSPFAWYVVMLWYAGYWSDQHTRLQRRHRLWLGLTTMLALGLTGLMVFASPLPSFSQVIVLDLSARQAIGGTSLLLVIYPAFIVLCIVLSIDALRRPEPSERVMGDLARQRARPWLIATSVLLLVVSFMVTWFMIWAIRGARAGTLDPFGTWVVQAVGLFDLVIASLVALAVISLGQGIVSHEVFTGKTLPRRGFFRHWRSAVILAGGYATVIGWGLAIHLRPIYSLLLTTILMVTFYALFGWRSFVERERFMARLRPFVGSQQLVHHLVGPEDEVPGRADAIFEALCRDVLNAQQGQLVPLGALAPLVGSPPIYPSTVQGQDPAALPADLVPTPDVSVVPLDPARYKGLQWAIPLWAERGLVGVLLLGQKQDGGLYTQEEIEIARASGERIIDMLAGEEMARRLMGLQRRRLAETQVLDGQARRTLHDEVLPDLHAAILRLSNQSHEEPVVQDALQMLTAMHHQLADLIQVLPGATLVTPGASSLADLIQEMVHVEFTREFEMIAWNAADNLPQLDPLVRQVVFYAVREVIRNAALHGRGDNPKRPLSLSIDISHDQELSVRIRDDGVGLAHRPGWTAMTSSGSQGGLALHSTMVAVVGGNLMVESLVDGGTQVTIALRTGMNSLAPASAS
jgi:signal transduction histidine kinase